MSRLSLSLLPLFLLPFIASCDKEADPMPPRQAPPVTVQKPSVRAVTTYASFPGQLAATETVEIRARITGFLESVNFEPSQSVQQGDLLFEIEPEEFEAKLTSARAALAEAEAAAQLRAVTLSKVEAAFERGGLNEIELEEAKAEHKQADALVQAAQAAVASAELELSYTRVTAPLSGRISRELVSVGNLLSGSQGTLLTTIVQDDPINVYFELSERDLLRYLRVRREDGSGESRRPIVAEIELLDGSRYGEQGTIDFAENRIDPDTGTLEIRATFSNEQGLLYPGMFVRLLLAGPEADAPKLLVPEVALMRDLAGPYVLIINEANIVQRQGVELGPRLGEERVIAGGLDAGQRVIVNGLQRAIPGNPVAPQPAAEPDPANSGASEPAASTTDGA